MNDFLNVVRNHYADFTGRARRREFWMFALFTAIITFILELPLLASMPALMAASQSAQNGDPAAMPSLPPLAWISIALVTLFGLAMLVPSLAVTVRRLHDTGKSGWWYLLSFIPFGGLVLLVFYILDSDPGTNKWGPNPKGVGNNAAAAAVTPTSNW